MIFRNESPVLGKDTMVEINPGGVANLYRIPVELTVVFNQVDATVPATQNVWVAPDTTKYGTYQLVRVDSIQSHVGGASAAVTVEKCTGTTAPGSGTALLSAAVDLTAAANTLVNGALTTTTADQQFATGDRLGVKFSGTLTALTGLCVTLTLVRIA